MNRTKGSGGVGMGSMPLWKSRRQWLNTESVYHGWGVARIPAGRREGGGGMYNGAILT